KSLSKLMPPAVTAMLSQLSLSSCTVGVKGVKLLNAASQLASLERLKLADARITTLAAKALATTHLRPLYLDLSRNPLGDEGLEALAGSPFLSRVRCLSLSNCELSSAGIRALVGADLTGLEELILSGNAIGDEGIRTLVGRPWPTLRVLGLEASELGASGL